jgi:hypothetical protein
VSPNGITFVDSTAEQFQMEFGNAETGDEVVFKRVFLDPPIVYISPTIQVVESMKAPEVKESARTSTQYPISLDSVSRTGFTVKLDKRNAPWAFSGTQHFNWIAVGR